VHLLLHTLSVCMVAAAAVAADCSAAWLDLADTTQLQHSQLHWQRLLGEAAMQLQ
jgi:hypothetical protein